MGVAVKVSAPVPPSRETVVLLPLPVAMAVTLLKPLATIWLVVLLPLVRVVVVGVIERR